MMVQGAAFLDGGNKPSVFSAPEISVQPAGIALGLLSCMMLLLVERKYYAKMQPAL